MTEKQRALWNEQMALVDRIGDSMMFGEPRKNRNAVYKELKEHVDAFVSDCRQYALLHAETNYLEAELNREWTPIDAAAAAERPPRNRWTDLHQLVGRMSLYMIAAWRL